MTTASTTRLVILDEDRVVTLVRPGVGDASDAEQAEGDQARAAGADIIVFRQGAIDAALIAGCPGVKLVRHLDMRGGGIDLAALSGRGVPVSCLNRPSLADTAGTPSC